MFLWAEKHPEEGGRCSGICLPQGLAAQHASSSSTRDGGRCSVGDLESARGLLCDPG